MPSSFNPNSPGVSLVIPTWNGRRLLSRYLPSAITAADSYARHAGASVEIIVVDDGSTDGTAAWLQAAHPRIIILRTEVNQGFAWACNLGFARAAHPIILLLNNDVRVDANILPLLVDHFSDPSVFAVCCKALDPETGHVATAGKVGEFKRGFWRVHGNYDVVRGPWSVASDVLQPTTDNRHHPLLLDSGQWWVFRFCRREAAAARRV